MAVGHLLWDYIDHDTHREQYSMTYICNQNWIVKDSQKHLSLKKNCDFMQVEFFVSIFSISRVMDIEPAVSPILVEYILLKWVVAYPGDLELFEQSQLLREFVDNSWDQPRIFLNDFEHVQLEDKFTSLFSFVFDHTEEIFKSFSDVQYNDDGDYILGYVSIKIPNEFVRETVIETAYLNEYGYRQVADFPFSE